VAHVVSGVGSGVKWFGRSRVNLDHVLKSWVAYRIAWLLCVVYGGDWVAWNLLKSRYLEAASESSMYMVDEQAFKHTLLTLIYDYGLVESDEYPQNPEEWARCLREWRERAARDKRIKKTPEEHCRAKVRRIVNVKATPKLCSLLLRELEERRKLYGIRLSPRIEKLLRSLAGENGEGEGV